LAFANDWGIGAHLGLEKYELVVLLKMFRRATARTKIPCETFLSFMVRGNREAHVVFVAAC